MLINSVNSKDYPGKRDREREKKKKEKKWLKDFWCLSSYIMFIGIQQGNNDLTLSVHQQHGHLLINVNMRKLFKLAPKL